MTTADNASQLRKDSRATRYPLTFYFLIAYAFAWLVWVPLANEK